MGSPEMLSFLIQSCVLPSLVYNPKKNILVNQLEFQLNSKAKEKILIPRHLTTITVPDMCPSLSYQVGRVCR